MTTQNANACLEKCGLNTKIKYTYMQKQQTICGDLCFHSSIYVICID